MMRPGSPYKFLDHFEPGDQALFFGREPEIRILQADIVVSRLVVLFARTGTGKTSLINAGVRPRLEERGYATFFIRVRQDPERSAREEIERQKHKLGAEPLEVALPRLSDALEKPVVLFFDQFEEFFLYVQDKTARDRFITAIAAIHRKQDSGIHIVFSMREEFFVQMDCFRDLIPTIFHNESNLRLRNFSAEQAREALVCPAKSSGVHLDSELVERVIADLTEEGEIAPAQLQIVADALWRSSSGDRITLETYRKLAHDSEKNVARLLLRQRLEWELSHVASEAQLKLLDKLLPQLATPKKTKWVRTVDELCRILDADAADLKALLALLEKLRLIRTVLATSEMLVELAHDYLVEHLDDFQKTVRRIWPKRLLAAAMDGSGKSMKPELMAVVEAAGDALELTSEELTFLFRSALKEGGKARDWFERAVRGGVDPWTVMAGVLDEGDLAGGAQAIYLAAMVEDPRAETWLRKALEHDRVIEEVIEALRRNPKPWGLKLLDYILSHPRLKKAKGHAILATVWLQRSREPAIANAAKEILSKQEPPEAPKVSFSIEPGSAPAKPPALQGPPYAVIADLLRKGAVIPFLGAGASLSIETEPKPPGARQLAMSLAEEVGAPDVSDLDVRKLASYFEVKKGRHALNDFMRRQFSLPFRPGAVHRFLAQFPAPFLIITTNFDDLMERAFEEAKRDYDVLIPGREGDALLHWNNGAWDWHKGAWMMSDLGKRPILLKLYGTADLRGSDVGHFLATEEDELKLLSGIGGGRLIPPELRMFMQSRPLLFLGHSLRDQGARLLLSLMREQHHSERSHPSWAILHEPSPMEAQLWEARNVRIYDQRVEEFIKGLQAAE